MPVLLIVVCLMLLWMYFANKGRSLLDAALMSTSLTSVFLVFGTLLLSEAVLLSTVGVIAYWCCVLALVWLVGFNRIRASVRPAIRRLSEIRLSGRDVVFVGVCAVFIIGTFIAAVLYPSTNWDSMTCHMTRVHIWISNGSTDLFPTPVATHNFTSPFSTWAITHVKLLASGADGFVNLVQWSSYIVTILAVYAIMRLFEIGRTPRRIAVGLGLSVPMAILQASSTQYDLVTSAHSAIAVYALLRLARHDALRGKHAWLSWPVFWAGASLGLAALSKPTGLIVAGPFALWALLTYCRRRGAREAFLAATVVVVVFAAVVSGWYVRNAVLLNGDALGASQPGNDHILIDDWSTGHLATNMVRNASQVLGTPSESLNRTIASSAGFLVGLWGDDIDDATNKEDADSPFLIAKGVTSHDEGPGIVSALIILATTGLAVGLRENRNIAMAYAFCAACAYLLPSAIITWNPYVVRVLLPALMLSTPLVGFGLDSLAKSHVSSSKVVRSIVCVSVATSAIYGAAVLAFGYTNPLAPMSVLPGRSGLEVKGWWNTPRWERATAVTCPEYAEFVRRVDTQVRSDSVEKLGIEAPVDSTVSFTYPLFERLSGVDVSFVGGSILGPSPIPVDGHQAIVVFSSGAPAAYPIAPLGGMSARRVFDYELVSTRQWASYFRVEP